MTGAPNLDAWLPEPHVRTCHRRSAAASAQALWSAASQVRLDETRTLGRLVRWRIPGLRDGLAFSELFREPPFVVLEEGDTWSISGLCGRLWTLERDYGDLRGPDDFGAWKTPGTARVIIAHWAQADGERAVLHSEGRVRAVDRGARLRLRALWALVGALERRIASEPLPLAAHRAELDFRPTATLQ